jgi:hypothetical protein
VTLFYVRNGFDGFTYGPLGTFLSELFPTNIRYSGTSQALWNHRSSTYDCDLAGDPIV